MKIKLQLNGENKDTDISNYDAEMVDSQFEVQFEIDEKNLEILENLLDYVIDDGGNLFNYSLIK